MLTYRISEHTSSLNSQGAGMLTFAAIAQISDRAYLRFGTESQIGPIWDLTKSQISNRAYLRFGTESQIVSI